MIPFTHPQAAERRRDRFLRVAETAPDLHEVRVGSDAAIPEIRGANDPLLQRAEQQLHEAITSIAQSIGVPPLQSGEIASMIQKATPSLRGMSRQQLASLSPSSSLLQSLAATTFNPAMTPEAAQRARLEQIKASYHGTGIDPTDALILRGERGRFRDGVGLDGYGRAGGRTSGSGTGVGGTDASGYSLLGGQRFSTYELATIQTARVEAVRAGVPWLGANEYRRDLAQIGPQGVRAIADVNIQQPSYQRLRTDGRFEAKEVVVLADYAKAKGIKDANRLAHTTADEVQLGKTEAERLQIKQVEVTYMQAAALAVKTPDDPAAQARLDAAAASRKGVLAPIAARSQHDYDVIRAQEDAMKLRAQDRVTEVIAVAKADAKDVKAAAVEKAADDLYAQAAVPSDPKGQPVKQAEVPASPTTGAMPTKAVTDASMPNDAVSQKAAETAKVAVTDPKAEQTKVAAVLPKPAAPKV